MKKYSLITLPFVLITMAFVRHQPAVLSMSETIITDTVPQVCNILPGKDIEALHPFTTPLSTTFPDPNSFETYTGCYYQFYTPNEKPQLAVRLMKWGSRQEAIDEYKIQAQRHIEMWGISPERLNVGADSVYFSIETMDPDKCDECGLVAAKGLYTIYISFKGQYDQITREGKKMTALSILKMMYDRIPGLAASRTRDKQ